MADRVGERTQNRPVVARIARRKRRALCHLRTPFGVDKDAGFFGIGRSRENDIRTMCATVAMRADVNDEGVVLDLDLVRAEQE